MLTADDFLLPPLPNHLFQRDNSCWIYGGVSINPMAKPARQRETLHSRGHLPLPPALRRRRFDVWYGGDDAPTPATIEGGDVHVLGHGTVLIGMGERTTPMAVEILARSLFAEGAADADHRDRAARVARVHAPRHSDDAWSTATRSSSTRTSISTSAPGP